MAGIMTRRQRAHVPTRYRARLRLCAQHGRDQEVQVLWGTRSQGPRGNRKAQAVRPRLKEAGNGNRGSTNRNRVRGAASQGERANLREALATKGGRRKPGDRAVKVTTLTWGDLASRLKGRRSEAEREVSRGRSSGPRSRAGCARTSEVSDGAKGRTERRANRS